MGLGMGVLRLEERCYDVEGVVAALLKGRGPMRGLLFPFSQYLAWSQLPLVACPTLPMPYCHPQSLPCCIFSLCPCGNILLLKKKTNNKTNNLEETLSLSFSSGLVLL